MERVFVEGGGGGGTCRDLSALKSMQVRVVGGRLARNGSLSRVVLFLIKQPL